uniref:DEAD/DEAH box helicase family protein n=1 Tax=Bacteroidota TaxID=976 RepID=UPI004047A123
MNHLHKILVSIPDWNAFFDYSKNLSKKEKGDLFEKLTELIFKTKSIYKSRFKNVWLLSEGIDLELRSKLNLPKADEGIDLIAENHTGTFCAIQCKFKGAHESPTRKDIATFLDLSRNHCKNITEQILVHTGTNGIKKTELLPDSFTQIGLDFWSQLTEEDWFAIQLLIKGEKVTSVKRNPRPHQQEAIAASVQYFLNDKSTRGKLIMPCGTGKSLTAFWIAQALASRTTIIAVPSLALLKQSLEDWTKEMLVFYEGELPEWCCICSDESAGKVSDNFVTDTYSLGIPTTTSEDEISTFLERISPGGKVIFTTYQSADKLAQVSQRLKFRFDLAILDEAHKTVGAKDKAFSILLQEDKISIGKRLFMTATERIVKGVEDDILSMDDEKVYGKIFYKLSFKKAIEESIITDYKIVTVLVNDAEIQDLIKKNKYVTDYGKKVDEAEAQMLTTAIALKKAIQEYSLKHIVSFHKSISASKEFQSLYQKIDNLADSPTVFHISSKLNAGARAELLRDFRNTSNAIITNARCLTEGVDVPAIDCVLFADQKQSIVDIVQASGRALRQYTDKKTGLKKEVGYIIIPVVLKENESLDNLTDSDKFKTVARIVTSLSTQDETIAEELKLIDAGKVKAKSSKIQVIGTINKSIKLDLSRLSLMIRTKIWERIAKINVLEFEEARSYSRSLNIQGYKEWLLLYDLGKIPKDIPKFPDGALEYKGKFKGWPDWLGNEENSIESNFKKGIKELEEYILSHGNSYVPEKHLTKSGFKLGQFCKMARQGTVKVKDRIDAINKITGWVWDIEEDKFKKMFEALKQFIEINNCLPNKGLNNTDVKIGDYKLNLGTWVFTLRSTYNKIQSGVVPATSNKRLLKDKNDPRIKLLESLPNWEWSLKIENMPFDEARGVVRKLKLKGRVDYTSWWRKLGKNIIPKIPAKPDKTYSKTGWLGWSDWIGINVISNQEKGKEKFSYKEAKAFLKINCSGIINSMSKFNKWKKGELTVNGLPVFPYRMPSAPQNAYIKNGEWISNYDFFGTIPKLVKKTKRIDFKLKKLPYQELKDIVQGQKLYSKAEYIKWLEKYKYELKEKGYYAPVKAESYSKEFEGWPVFLGKISV